MQKLEIETAPDVFEGVVDEMERTFFWLNQAKKEIKRKDVEKFVGLIISSRDKGIYLTGSGRSELIARAIAMRLMHLGFKAFVIGDSTTPRMEEGELLIVISGSGESKQKVTKSAFRTGVIIAAVTSCLESPIGKLANVAVMLPEGDKSLDYNQRKSMGLPIAPLNSLFENIASAFLEAVIGYLAHAMGKTEEDLNRRHAVSE